MNVSPLPSLFSPEHLVDELRDFSQKLTQGIASLRQLENIDVGVTPKQAVYHEDKLCLYRYTPLQRQLNPVPTLLIYALVNRPYMTDLQPDRSLIRGLLEAGQDVYLIDWGYPDIQDRDLSLDTYINAYIDHCVDYLRDEHQLDKINILGICQGGVFSLCYSALHPDKVRNLITMVTPVDFHTEDNQLSHLCRHINIDLLIDNLGNLPGSMLNQLFLSLKPFRLTSQKYLDMLDIAHDSEALANFLRMEKWIFDSPDQAGEALRQFVKDFFQQNKLIKGEVRIGSELVKLSRLQMPILNIYATHDHIVPPAASQALARYVGSEDYTELDFKGGHIGIYVSNRAQKEVPPTISEWLNQRTLDAK